LREVLELFPKGEWKWKGTHPSQYLLRRLLLGIFFTRFAPETPYDSSTGVKGPFLMMKKAYRYHIYPSKRQATHLGRRSSGIDFVVDQTGLVPYRRPISLHPGTLLSSRPCAIPGQGATTP
jgi:hypothetical protein